MISLFWCNNAMRVWNIVCKIKNRTHTHNYSTYFIIPHQTKFVGEYVLSWSFRTFVGPYFHPGWYLINRLVLSYSLCILKADLQLFAVWPIYITTISPLRCKNFNFLELILLCQCSVFYFRWGISLRRNCTYMLKLKRFSIN